MNVYHFCGQHFKNIDVFVRSFAALFQNKIKKHASTQNNTKISTEVDEQQCRYECFQQSRA